MQIFGHSNPRTTQHYLTQHVKFDTQACFRNRDTSKRLAPSTMCSTSDPRAPREASSECLEERERQDPELLSLLAARQDMRFQPKDPALRVRQRELTTKINNRKKQIQRAAEKECRSDYFENMFANEIRAQLEDNLLEDYHEPPRPHYALEERRYIVDSFFGPEKTREGMAFQDYSERQPPILQEVIRVLTRLCNLHEPRAGTESRRDNKNVATATKEFNCTEYQCLFCLGSLWRGKVPMQTDFSRPDGCRRHIMKFHLGLLGDKGEHFPCPHPQCEEVMEGKDHFRNHARTVHELKY